MDGVGLAVGLATLCCVIVLIWRIWVVENNLNVRIDGIDHSLAVVVGGIIEKIDSMSSLVPDINLINQNPLAQLFEFLKGNAPTNEFNGAPPTPRATNGQFETIEVENNGTVTKEE